MLGIMPTGLAPGSNTAVVSLFWILRADRYAALQDAGLHAWKDTVLALNPACADLLAHITSINQLTWALPRHCDAALPHPQHSRDWRRRPRHQPAARPRH